MADSAKERISIAAPLARVFEVITDIERYPEWAPDIKATKVLDRDEHDRPIEAEFRAAAMGRSVSVRLRYDYTGAPSRMSWQVVESDTVRRYDGTYVLDATDEATTEVDYELTVELLVPLPSFVKRRAEHRIVKAAMPELKSYIESGRAAATDAPAG